MREGVVALNALGASQPGSMSYRSFRIPSSSLPRGLLRRATVEAGQVYTVCCTEIRSIADLCIENATVRGTQMKVEEFVAWWTDLCEKKGVSRWSGSLPETCPEEFDGVIIFKNAEELGDNCEDSESEHSENVFSDDSSDNEGDERTSKRVRVDVRDVLVLLGDEPAYESASEADISAAMRMAIQEGSESDTDSNFEPDSDSSSDEDGDTCSGSGGSDEDF